MTLEIIYKLLICHVIGDYVLQTDYIAKNKVTSFYILLIHSLLYTVPFYFIGWSIIELSMLFVSHLFIDYCKCIKLYKLVMDQFLHYVVILILYIVL